MTTPSLIYLVSNDDLPAIVGQIVDSVTALPVDLSDPTTTVNAKFRKKGTSTVLFTTVCSKVGGGSSGQWKMDWPSGELDDLNGRYELEIYVDYNGSVQTIYDVIPFKIRDDF